MRYLPEVIGLKPTAIIPVLVVDDFGTHLLASATATDGDQEVVAAMSLPLARLIVRLDGECGELPRYGSLEASTRHLAQGWLGWLPSKEWWCVGLRELDPR
jgi:hypothetical protein